MGRFSRHDVGTVRRLGSYGKYGNQKDTSGPVPGAYTLGQIVELAASWGDSHAGRVVPAI